VAGSAVGLAGSDAYNGNDLIREAGGNVVVVVIQYRLGAFGFLAGQKVKDGAVLNAGLCKYHKLFDVDPSSEKECPLS